MRSRRARRVYYTTSLEYETEIEGGGVRLSLFVAREVGVLIKGQVIKSWRQSVEKLAARGAGT